MTDQTCIERWLGEIKPDYIINLAAQSHVKVSFDVPQYTFMVDAVGVLNMLEAYRRICPNAKMYQASSSECFGASVDSDGFQRESTPMIPASPYACAKVAGYNLVRHYRRAYDLHACNGILFNFESPRRGETFVTQKVAKRAVEIKLGLADRLELGNMMSCRDWGHAKDAVRAIWAIVNHIKADDFVIATGVTRTVSDLCNTVFSYLGMDYTEYVTPNAKYFRPEEVPYLRGDAIRAKIILGWEPTYTFESMMHEMVDHWIKKLSK
jgi:GDPmannose 4,6-dehydratase